MCVLIEIILRAHMKRMNLCYNAFNLSMGAPLNEC
jgi:hypothetical protein